MAHDVPTQPMNPFAPPQADVRRDEPLQADALEPAGRWRRFFGLLVDYVGHLIFGGLIGAVVGFAGAMTGHLQAWAAHLSGPLFGLLAMFAYYVVLEGAFGRTLGKLVTGTRVVSVDGRRASFKQVVGRTLCRLIPFEMFSIFREERTTWHDSIPRTRVVRVQRA
jgi:uncharacterized RDD family membrane protein YckC